MASASAVISDGVAGLNGIQRRPRLLPIIRIRRSSPPLANDSDASADAVKLKIVQKSKQSSLVQKVVDCGCREQTTLNHKSERTVTNQFTKFSVSRAAACEIK